MGLPGILSTSAIASWPVLVSVKRWQSCTGFYVRPLTLGAVLVWAMRIVMGPRLNTEAVFALGLILKSNRGIEEDRMQICWLACSWF
jgi:hypothetical protein